MDNISGSKEAFCTVTFKAGTTGEVETSNDLQTNDSSTFAQMETVNLLPPEMTAQPLNSSSDPSSKPLSISVESSSVQNPRSGIGEESGSNSGTLSLSKYFQTVPQPQDSSAPEAFFNRIESLRIEDPKEKAKDNVAGTVGSDNLTSSHPALQKYFAESKSGKDADGKAFFDQIASAPAPIVLAGGINSGNKLDSGFEYEQVFTHTVVPKKPVDMPLLGSPPSHVEIYEAWIPSEATQEELRSFASSPDTFILQKQNFTEPSVIIEEDLEDPIKVLLIETNSPLASQRKVLTANDVLQNEDGLKELIDADCYHAAINLTTRMLKSGYGIEQNCKTPKLLQLWFTRIALFVKLGKFSYAEVECEAFGNFERPDLYYEFYPNMYPKRKGTLVPFSFRLLAAQLPQYQGNHQVALNRLYAILLTVHKITLNLEKGLSEDGCAEISEERKNAALELWKTREIKVLYAVLNCVLGQKDYAMAISVAHILLDKDTEHTAQLYSALGRIYLQLGDLKEARAYFDRVTDCKNVPQEVLQLEEYVNSALYAVAHNDNKEAYKMYKQALALSPDNPMLVNNVAVCLLYMGRLKDSLNLLEKSIQANPKACLYEGILFNICTLYELESSHCTAKKQAMLNLVAKYAGDNLNVSCLKIPPNPK